MAEYYYCNGTTKKGNPCSLPVKMEGDKCRYHDDSDSPPGRDPLDLGGKIYKIGKKGLDGLVYLFAVNEAAPWVVEIGEKFIEIISPFLLIEEYVDINDFQDIYAEKEAAIITGLMSLPEDRLQYFINMNLYIESEADQQGQFEPEPMFATA